MLRMANMNVPNLDLARRVVLFSNKKSVRAADHEKRILFLYERSRNVYENK